MMRPPALRGAYFVIDWSDGGFDGGLDMIVVLVLEGFIYEIVVFLLENFTAAEKEPLFLKIG